jgi:DNA polymerase
MPDLYHDLLIATLEHVQRLKAGGSRFADVSPATLAALKNSPPTPAPALARTASATAPALVIAADSAAPSASVAPAAKSRDVARTPAPAVPPATPIAVHTSTAPTLASPVSAPPTPVAALAPTTVLEPAAKLAAMTELRERALVCVKCPNLASSRTNVVFGVGDIDAVLMFVGEAPGADEDAKGEPFVGAAGQLLTRIIQTMGLSRQTVYIANILKCRPDTPGQSSGNRKPTLDEMKTCVPYLHSQIDLIRPKVLVALGGTAIEGLLGKTEGITRLRGNWREYRGIPLMPTFHPSYLLRNQALAEKRKVWEDMLQVMDRLDMAISEKQRGYFLRGPHEAQGSRRLNDGSVATEDTEEQRGI